MLYEGVPRKRRKAVKGANKVACARCGVPGCSRDMVWQQADAPGYARIRALVHKECKDVPNPGARPTRTRPMKPPYQQQAVSITQTTHTDDITCSAAVFVATGTTSATLAQVTADPTVSLTGTNFTARTYGRVRHNSTGPLLRTTTYVGATNITFELDALDLNTGTLSVGAAKINAGTQVSEAIALTVT